MWPLTILYPRFKHPSNSLLETRNTENNGRKTWRRCRVKRQFAASELPRITPPGEVFVVSSLDFTPKEHRDVLTEEGFTTYVEFHFRAQSLRPERSINFNGSAIPCIDGYTGFNDRVFIERLEELKFEMLIGESANTDPVVVHPAER